MFKLQISDTAFLTCALICFHSFSADSVLNIDTGTRKHSSRIRTTHLPIIRASAPADVSTDSGRGVVVLRWTRLGPGLGSLYIEVSWGHGGSLYSKVSCLGSRARGSCIVRSNAVWVMVMGDPSPCAQIHKWKHYLPATSLAGDTLIIFSSLSHEENGQMEAKQTLLFWVKWPSIPPLPHQRETLKFDTKFLTRGSYFPSKGSLAEKNLNFELSSLSV